MQETIQEFLNTGEKGKYGVIVCGGGVAGIAAAVSSARQGVNVLLLEKSTNLGGLATSGLISWYEPICDGMGKKIMYGMASELMQLAIKYGPDTLDPAWKDDPDTADMTDKRYASFFSPSLLSLALDSWVLESNVKIQFDTLVVQTVMGGNRCRGVIAEQKDGRYFYKSKAVIDATGDADILYRSGAPCVEGKNFLTYIAYISDNRTLSKSLMSDNILASRKWISVGSDLFGNGHPEDFPVTTGVTAEEITSFLISGRRLFFKKIKDREKGTYDVTCLPTIPQLRTTRRLEGVYTLKENDRNRHFKDSVGLASDFLNRGHVYEIPYRILFNNQVENIFCAGRCVSSSGWAWEVTRVIPVAVATGQAAGIAAALCIEHDVPASALDISILQDELKKSGVCLRI